MMQEPETKRWTSTSKAKLIRQTYNGRPTIEEVSLQCDLTPCEIAFVDYAEAGMQNGPKANPKGLAAQYKKKLSTHKESLGEATFEVKLLKALWPISPRTRSSRIIGRWGSKGRRDPSKKLIGVLSRDFYDVRRRRAQ